MTGAAAPQHSVGRHRRRLARGCGRGGAPNAQPSRCAHRFVGSGRHRLRSGCGLVGVVPRCTRRRCGRRSRCRAGCAQRPPAPPRRMHSQRAEEMVTELWHEVFAAPAAAGEGEGSRGKSQRPDRGEQGVDTTAGREGGRRGRRRGCQQSEAHHVRRRELARNPAASSRCRRRSVSSTNRPWRRGCARIPTRCWRCSPTWWVPPIGGSASWRSVSPRRCSSTSHGVARCAHAVWARCASCRIARTAAISTSTPAWRRSWRVVAGPSTPSALTASARLGASAARAVPAGRPQRLDGW